MTLLLHPPSDVEVRGDVPDEDRMRLQRVVLAAVSNALGRAAADAAGVRLVATAGSVAGRRPAGLDRDAHTYRLPSYQDGSGDPVDVPVQPTATAHAGGGHEPAPHSPHPHLAADVDEVSETASPFDGQTIALLSIDRVVSVGSPRYAVSGALVRAIRWGNLLFGASSYAIYEGPIGRPETERRYWTVRTNEPVSRRDLRNVGELRGQPGRYAFRATGWIPTVQDTDRLTYVLRGLITREREAIFPPDVTLLEEFWGEVRASAPGEAVVEEDRARQVLFAAIDGLVAAGETQAAADRLSELDAQAFALVTWEKRAEYLGVLVRAWTREPQERAVVELLKASASRSELDAALDILRHRGLFEQLFDDLDSELFSLLVVVGEKFGEPAPLTLDELATLMQDVQLLPRDWTSVVVGITFGPAGPLVSADLVSEAYEAARSFVRFLGGLLEAIVMVLTRPQDLIEGVSQLERLIVAIELAKVGHRPSQQLVERTVQGVGRQVLFGLRGVHVLGVGEQVARRVKWTLVWEIASLFIGVGEVTAVLKGAGLTERLAAIARMLGILRGVGEVVEAETLATRVGRLVRALRAESQVFAHEDELLQFLSHLPDEDVVRVGRLLREADIAEGATLAALRESHPELAEAASDALRRAEVLRTLAGKAGGLSEEVAEMLTRLTRRGRFSVEEAAEIAHAIPDGEFPRFARALEAIPAQALGEAGGISSDLVKGIAGSPKRMDAVATLGLDTYRALEWRVGGRLELLDRHLDTLAELEAAFGRANRRADYRRYLDRLASGDTRAWEHLEDATRRPSGQRPLPVSFDAESEWQRYDTFRRRRLADLRRESDPIARQVVSDYRARTTEDLRRLEQEGDQLASDILDERLGGQARPYLPDRPSNPAVQSQLRDELARFRQQVEASRPAPLQTEPPDWTRTAKPEWSPEPIEVVPTGKEVRRHPGTLGVATSDVPGMQGRILRGGSPQGGGRVGTGGRIAPDPELARVPQAHSHAEQDLANQIDGALSGLPPDDYARANGRTVWLHVDQEVCSTCAAGLRSGGRPGVLQQLSRLHPGIVFEISADDTSRVIRILGGVMLP